MMIPQASTSAEQVDLAFYIILGIEVILLVLVTSAMIYFVLRYRRTKNGLPEHVAGSTLLEITWTIIPTLIVLVMFFVGWKSFESIRTIPQKTMGIEVTSRQWTWLFSYANGKQSAVLRIPVNKPVELLLSSRDVLHSFYVPAFRIKEDCVPNMETYLSFTARKTGTYDIFCTEYCGLGHSDMISQVIVMEEKDFAAWYDAVPALKTGQQLLEGKGCLGCHSLDGTKKIGPTFKGLYHSQKTIVTGGKEHTLRVDEEYLRRSITEPKADVVKGYPDIMPTIPVAPEELRDLIEYLATLK